MPCFLQLFVYIQSFALIWETENAETEMMKPYMLSIPPNNHGIQPALLIDEETKLSHDNLLTTIPIWSTEWSVSFNIRISSLNGDKWKNLIAFTNNPSNLYQYGFRTPAVFINTQGKYFHFFSAVNGNLDACYGRRNINLNQKYHIEIHQRYIANGEYKYYVVVDGVEVHSVVNRDARQFYNVRVYASDPHHQPGDAHISNFKYVNFL